MTVQGKQGARQGLRPRTILLILVLLFLIPFVIALMMFKGHHILGRLLNHGSLIKPPFSISLLKLRNERGKLLNKRLRKNSKWMLMYFNPGLCETSCRKGLHNLQLARKATGKNRDRVTRSLLTYPSNPANDFAINIIISENYPGTRHLTIEEKQFTDVVRKHVNKAYALHAGTVYLIDPLGNVIMTYAPNAKPNGIFKDLQRLLRASQIG